MSELSLQLNTLTDISRREDFRIHSMSTEEHYELVHSVLPMDYRAVLSPTLGYASVLEGLAFDPDRIRSQAFYLDTPEGIPIAVMNFLIAPKIWIETQRFVTNTNGKLIITDLKGVMDFEESPDFVIIPGWTVVKEEFRTYFAHTGFKFFKNIMNEIQKQAPSNTYLLVVAQGKLPKEQSTFLQDYSIGHEIDSSSFDINDLGENNTGSNSSVKMARLLGLTKIPNVGSARSFGPVYLKKIQ